MSHTNHQESQNQSGHPSASGGDFIPFKFVPVSNASQKQSQQTCLLGKRTSQVSQQHHQKNHNPLKLLSSSTNAKSTSTNIAIHEDGSHSQSANLQKEPLTRTRCATYLTGKIRSIQHSLENGNSNAQVLKILSSWEKIPSETQANYIKKPNSDKLKSMREEKCRKCYTNAELMLEYEKALLQMLEDVEREFFSRKAKGSAKQAVLPPSKPWLPVLRARCSKPVEEWVDLEIRELEKQLGVKEREIKIAPFKSSSCDRLGSQKLSAKSTVTVNSENQEQHRSSSQSERPDNTKRRKTSQASLQESQSSSSSKPQKSVKKGGQAKLRPNSSLGVVNQKELESSRLTSKRRRQLVELYREANAPVVPKNKYYYHPDMVQSLYGEIQAEGKAGRNYAFTSSFRNAQGVCRVYAGCVPARGLSGLSWELTEAHQVSNYLLGIGDEAFLLVLHDGEKADLALQEDTEVLMRRYNIPFVCFLQRQQISLDFSALKFYYLNQIHRFIETAQFQSSTDLGWFVISQEHPSVSSQCKFLSESDPVGKTFYLTEFTTETIVDGRGSHCNKIAKEARYEGSQYNLIFKPHPCHEFGRLEKKNRIQECVDAEKSRQLLNMKARLAADAQVTPLFGLGDKKDTNEKQQQDVDELELKSTENGSQNFSNSASNCNSKTSKNFMGQDYSCFSNQLSQSQQQNLLQCAIQQSQFVPSNQQLIQQIPKVYHQQMGSPTRVHDQCGPLNNYQQFMQHTPSSYIGGLPMSPNSHQSQIFQLGCPSVNGFDEFSMHSNQFNAAPPSLYGHHPFVPEVLPDFHDEVQFPKYKQEKMDYNEKADFKDIRQYLSFQEYILCKHYCNSQSTVDEALLYRSQGKKLKFGYHNGVGLVHCIVGSKAPDQQTQLREDQVAN